MHTDDFVPFDPAMTGASDGFSGFFALVALLVVAGVVVTAVKAFSQWQANEAAPLRSVDALVVSRRTDVRRRAGTPGTIGAPGTIGPPGTIGTTGAPMVMGTPASSTTTYFVTFEEDSGARRELQVSGPEFGQLAEGDRGHLIHQGTRYKGFTRAATR